MKTESKNNTLDAHLRFDYSIPEASWEKSYIAMVDSEFFMNFFHCDY